MAFIMAGPAMAGPFSPARRPTDREQIEAPAAGLFGHRQMIFSARPELAPFALRDVQNPQHAEIIQ
jgi:hypothetical protein